MRCTTVLEFHQLLSFFVFLNRESEDNDLLLNVIKYDLVPELDVVSKTHKGWVSGFASKTRLETADQA